METTIEKSKIKTIIKERYYRDLISAHLSALKYLVKIAQDFLTLNLGQITLDDLEQICNQDFTNIKSRFTKSIDAEIKNLKNQIMRDNVSAGTMDTYNQFESNSNKNASWFRNCGYNLLQSPEHLSVKNYTVEKGEVSLTDKNLEFILNEYCTIHISTPQKERYVEVVNEVLKGLQELKAMHIEYNLGTIFSIQGEDPGVFDETDEGIALSTMENVEFLTSK